MFWQVIIVEKVNPKNTEMLKIQDQKPVIPKWLGANITMYNINPNKIDVKKTNVNTFKKKCVTLIKFLNM